MSQVVQTLTQAEQAYICLWSHAGWRTAHIQFIVQPARNAWREEYDRPGAFVQAAMFQAANPRRSPKLKKRPTPWLTVPLTGLDARI